jgi:hypothetical protein
MPTRIHITTESLEPSAYRWNSVYTTTRANSAVWQGSADAQVQELSGILQSTYTTVNSNSATSWNYQGTDLKDLSGNWQTTYTTVSSLSSRWDEVYTSYNQNSADYVNFQYVDGKFLPLTGGTVTGAIRFNNDVTVYGNLTATGISYFSNTVYTTTSALSIVNLSNTGPAFYVANNGTGDLASFYDLDQNVEVFHVGGSNGSFPNVGVKTSFPNKDLTVQGEISASGDIWTSGKLLSGGQDVLSIIASSSPKFTNDLTVSLSNNKTFGRYTNGQIIPATGKTASEVIQMALAEPINPTVNLTSSSTIAFNLTAISNVLNFNHTINTLGATVATAFLEWRRGNTGSWSVLSSSTTSPGSFTHTLSDTAYNTNQFNYRYVVTDTAMASTTATLNITPAAYSQPTISFSLSGSVTSPETNTIREKGNVSSNITSGTITRNSVNVPLVSYIVQFQVNGTNPSLWTDIGTPTSISGNSYSIPTFNHVPTSTANSVSYRIKVIDKYQEFLSSQVYSNTSTINFKNIIFYGTGSSAPTNSTQVRALTGKIFTDGPNPFILYSGTTNTKFTVAMPNTLSITSVFDLDASNANLTTSYVNNPFSVNDYAGNSVSYNVYTCSISTPYTPNEHRHQITRG